MTDAPNRRGPGRKTIASSGERMKNRQIRMTDEQWAHCKSVGGGAWVRERIENDKRAGTLGAETRQ